MKRLWLASIPLTAVMVLPEVITRPGVVQRPTAGTESAYRANNLGVARLEQFDYEAAAASFQQALQVNP
ncbi:MAG: tetratricopeptide repeat protein, partial [Acidobacteria bacterium]|nr:tetratricopeptide repeat protein [Acidobacteriota bacterium]